MPLTGLAGRKPEPCKSQLRVPESHTDIWIINSHNNFRTILLAILSMYECFEEGRQAGAHPTVNGAKTGKPNSSEAEETTRSLSGRLQVAGGTQLSQVIKYPASQLLLR